MRTPAYPFADTPTALLTTSRSPSHGRGGQSSEPFVRRAARWDTTSFPAPVDLVVYSTEEWERFGREGRKLDRRADLIWLELPGRPRKA